MSKHPLAEATGAIAATSGGLVCTGWLGDAELGRLDSAGLAAILSDIGKLRNRLDGYQSKVLGKMAELRKRGGATEPKPHLAVKNATGMSERDARQAARRAENANAASVLRAGAATATECSSCGQGSIR